MFIIVEERCGALWVAIGNVKKGLSSRDSVAPWVVAVEDPLHRPIIAAENNESIVIHGLIIIIGMFESIECGEGMVVCLSLGL